MAKRRRFGWVRKLPSGRYQASYFDPRTSVRVSAHTTFKTKTAADHWLVDIEASLRRGDLADLRGGRLPFEYWANHWLDTRQVRPKTLRNYRSLLEHHIVPEFQNVAVANISRQDVSKFVAKKLNDGMTEGTLANVRRTFSHGAHRSCTFRRDSS